MNLPANWNNVQPASQEGFKKPSPGAYKMVIRHAKEEVSKSSNRPMISIALDIASGAFTGHYSQLFNKLVTTNPQAKYPLVIRQCTDERSISYFKGLVTAIEESNPGFKFNGDCNLLRGKYVGCMLVDEIKPDGRSFLVPDYCCSVAKAESGKLVPRVKKASQASGFGDVGGGAVDSLSFTPQNHPFGQPAPMDDLPF